MSTTTTEPTGTPVTMDKEILEERKAQLEERAAEHEPSAAALKRIDEGTYGTCHNCGRWIEYARLKALPHIETCIECGKAESLNPIREAAQAAAQTASGNGTSRGPEKVFSDDVLPGSSALGARTIEADKIRLVQNIRDGEIEVDEELQGLAASIAAIGLKQRINVCPTPDGFYELVDGYRRFAAMTKVLGWTEVPCEVEHSSDQERLEAMLITAVQRKSLKPIEEARALSQLVNRFGVSQRELSARTGVSQSVISKRISLLELPDKAIELVDSGGITLDDAQELHKLRDHPKRQASVLEGFDPTNKYADLGGRVKRELQEVKRAESLKKIRKKLRDDKVRIYSDEAYQKIPTDQRAHLGSRPGELDVDPKEHAGEPCHGALVDSYSSSTMVTLVCVDVKRHRKRAGDSKLKASVIPYGGQMSLEEKADVDFKKELGAEQERRRVFLVEFLARRPKTTEAFDLIALTLGTRARIRRGDPSEGLSEMLGIAVDDDAGAWIADYAGKSPDNKIRLALGMAIDDIERALAQAHQWYGTPQKWSLDFVPYFEFLERHGYELSKTELLNIDVTEADEGAA